VYETTVIFGSALVSRKKMEIRYETVVQPIPEAARYKA
jgi:hypothetical protein